MQRIPPHRRHRSDQRLSAPTLSAVGLALLVVMIAGCASVAPDRDFEDEDGAPTRPVDLSKVSNAVPKPEPYSRYGNPDSYTVYGQRYRVMADARGYRARGIASWYGTKFHGRRTSSGERYDMYAMTAAHKTLPLPTYAEVTNLDNGRSVVVKINDRGPFHDDRLIDLSYAAAFKLGILGQGTGRVEVRAIDTSPDADIVVADGDPAAGIYLQVGAFANRANAERLHSRVANALVDASKVRIRRAGAAQRTVYRVHIGPLPSAADATQLAERLATLGFARPHLVGD